MLNDSSDNRSKLNTRFRSADETRSPSRRKFTRNSRSHKLHPARRGTRASPTPRPSCISAVSPVSSNPDSVYPMARAAENFPSFSDPPKTPPAAPASTPTAPEIYSAPSLGRQKSLPRWIHLLPSFSPKNLSRIQANPTRQFQAFDKSYQSPLAIRNPYLALVRT